jgi:hypothetical protein
MPACPTPPEQVLPTSVTDDGSRGSQMIALGDMSGVVQVSGPGPGPQPFVRCGWCEQAYKTSETASSAVQGKGKSPTFAATVAAITCR